MTDSEIPGPEMKSMRYPKQWCGDMPVILSLAIQIAVVAVVSVGIVWGAMTVGYIFYRWLA